MKKKLIISAFTVMAITVGITLFAGNKADASDSPEQNSAMLCEQTDSAVPLYSVNGATLKPEYQQYIWSLMCEWGTTDAYRYWLAEIYQESRYDETATNGRDWGLCQLRDTYHSYLIQASGCAGTDLKYDSYANLYCGTWLFSAYYKQFNRCLMDAVEEYYNSGDVATEMQYYMDVSQWYSTIERIN